MSTDTGTGAAEGAKTDDGTTAATGGEGGTGTAESQTGRTFTQEELSAIVAREVAKAKDPEMVKKAQAYDQLQKEQQTEAERAATAQREAEERAAKAIATANERLVRAELKLQLAAQGARPDAVDLAVDRLLATGEIEVDDKGEVKGAEAAVKELLKTHEYLKADTEKKLPDKSGGDFKANDPASIDDQIAKLEAEGKWKDARALKLRKHETGKAT